MSTKTRTLRRNRAKRFRNWFSGNGGVDILRSLPPDKQLDVYELARESFVKGFRLGRLAKIEAEAR